MAEVAWRFIISSSFGRKVLMQIKKVASSSGCGGGAAPYWNVSVWAHSLSSVIWRPRGGREHTRCCNNITERLTGIALPLLNMTADWKCVTREAKVLALLRPKAAAAVEVWRYSLRVCFCLFSLVKGVVVKAAGTNCIVKNLNRDTLKWL